jgi:hypothetical protein
MKRLLNFRYCDSLIYPVKRHKLNLLATVRNGLGIAILLFMASPIGLLKAQGIDEGMFFSRQNAYGTARAMSMGGAFGALGGDASSIAINPAGIAVYRSSEFAFTPAFQFDKAESSYFGNRSEDDKTHLPIGQISYIGTNQLLREGNGFVSSSFGFTYQRVNDYSANMQMFGNNIGSSLIDQFVFEAEGRSTDELYYPGHGFGYSTYLMNPVPETNGYYYNTIFETYMLDGDGNPVKDEFGNVIIYRDPSFAPNGVNQWKNVQRSGYTGEYALSYGANFGNRVFVGASLGIQNIFYKETSTYAEMDPDNSIVDFREFQYYNSLKTIGTGLNLKVGVIYKPVNALRLGLALHTPTYYSLSDSYRGEMVSMFDNDPKTSDSQSGEYDYNFRTPFKAIASAAVVLGKAGILSVDYELVNYKSMKFSGSEETLEEIRYFSALNEQVKSIYRATSNIRAGLELRMNEMFSVRGGVGFIGSPYQKGQLNDDSHTMNYSVGLGYRTKNFFMDMAYRLSTQSYKYYMYRLDNSQITENGGYINASEYQPVSIDMTNNLALVTFGWKF